MKRIGPGDISYCGTKCEQKLCKRNLQYWQPPTRFCSMSNFDESCQDMMHPDCEHMWLAEEEKKRGRPEKVTSRES